MVSARPGVCVKGSDEILDGSIYDVVSTRRLFSLYDLSSLCFCCLLEDVPW